MYGPLYRRVLQPTFERVVKGRRTLEYWDLSEIRQWWSREHLEAFQLKALRNLLVHAFETCPYSRETWDSQRLDPRGLTSLEEFRAWPLLTRDLIRQHRSQMRSVVPYKIISKSTGGSSSEPLHFDLNAASHERRTAMMYRGYNWAGGAPGTKQLYIWGSHVGRVSPMQRWKQAVHAKIERRKIVSCFQVTPAKMRRHFRVLNRYRPQVVVAYTNPLYEFARYLGEHNLRPFSPQSIIVGAEKLHDFQREKIEKVFRAPVFETYGSREFMLIGAECERHCGLHLSIDNLLVEILDDDGLPTPPGEEGNVVITDLFNFGMPFVRYVNGDRALSGFEMCPCGRGLPLLKQVVGRRLDVLETPDGRKISGEFFPHLMKEFPSIRRFQVVQETPDSIMLRLVVDADFSQADHAMLLSEIYRCVGTAVDFQIELVDEIPLTRTGKLQVVARAT
jgi:phenylacetate-CoA ligase